MPAHRALGSRGVGVAALAALTVMVLGVCSALILMTTELHRSSATLRDASAGVRLAQRAQIDLLVLHHADDPVSRASLENDLKQNLLEAREVVGSPQEEAALKEATVRVDRYLVAGGQGRPALLGTTLEGLSRLVSINVAQAATAQQQSIWWDRVADLVGISAGVLMIAILVFLSLWVRRNVFQPVHHLSRTMERFASGEVAARAPETGTADLRWMAGVFNRMAASIAQQNQSRLTYLAGVAHDLRNPLSALQMSTALLDPDRGAPSPTRVDQVLGVVRRQVTRLNRMVGDLLETARIESGHLTLRKEEHDLRDIAREVVDLFRGTSTRHEILFEPGGDELIAQCDALRIEQTLNNLVSNAIKYSPQGGEIRVDTRRDGSWAVMTVADNGIGIDPEDSRHMWEPFRRSSGSADAIPGVGLGLSTSRRIVEAHGGEITVESTPGVGSTFAVRLPLARMADRAVPEPESPAPP